jgi:CDP-glucose 4,6-dehydratase
MDYKIIKEFYKNKTVLITGNTGFKGSWLSFILSQIFKSNVIGYSLEPNTSPNLYSILNIHKKSKTYFKDVRNFKDLNQVILETKPEIIFHLAAQPLVLDSYKSPKETYEINSFGTLNILEVLRTTSFVKSFLNVTTDKVYKNIESIWGYRENEELDGYDPYSNSKSISELITRTYKRSFKINTSISTARAGNVIGGGDFSSNRIMVDCIKSAQKKQVIEIRNPKSIRPYQHVFESLFGYLLIAQKQYENIDFSGEFNIGPNFDDCVNNKIFVEKFIEHYNEGLQWKDISLDLPHEANFLFLDNSRMKKTFGFIPKMNISEAIKISIEWYKHNFLSKDSIEDFSLTQIQKYMEL